MVESPVKCLRIRGLREPPRTPSASPRYPHLCSTGATPALLSASATPFPPSLPPPSPWSAETLASLPSGAAASQHLLPGS